MRSARIRSLPIAVLMAAIALLVSAGPAAAATIPITGGEVDWGIKQSFREYVKGPIAKGQIEVSGGATEAADGTYKFPVSSGTYDLTTHQVEVQGIGTVHFTGHDMGAGPLLDVTFTNPRVIVGQTSVIYADVIKQDVPRRRSEELPQRRIRAGRRQPHQTRLRRRSGDAEQNADRTDRGRGRNVQQLPPRRRRTGPAHVGRLLRAEGSIGRTEERRAEAGRSDPDSHPDPDDADAEVERRTVEARWRRFGHGRHDHLLLDPALHAAGAEERHVQGRWQVVQRQGDRAEAGLARQERRKRP